jgi:hypothetical protein
MVIVPVGPLQGFATVDARRGCCCTLLLYLWCQRDLARQRSVGHASPDKLRSQRPSRHPPLHSVVCSDTDGITLKV